MKKFLPKELIVEGSSLEKSGAVSEGGPMGVLSNLLDTATGLGYCMNDESFYREMLTEYAKNDRSVELDNSLAKGDVENYRIAIHSLKSTSLTIGAVQLSEMAKALESACKEGNLEFVRSQHEKCMKSYKMILDKLSKFLAVGEL